MDEAALRTTQAVDILIRPADLPTLVAAMTAAGFHHRTTSGIDMFVEHPDASARDAVHVLLVGTVERGGASPIRISFLPSGRMTPRRSLWKRSCA